MGLQRVGHNWATFMFMFFSPKYRIEEQILGKHTHTHTLRHIVNLGKVKNKRCKTITVPHWPSLVTQSVKNMPAMQQTWVRSLGWEDLLEMGMTTHFSSLAWRSPCTEEPGGLQFMGSQSVGHYWVTNIFTCGPNRILLGRHCEDPLPFSGENSCIICRFCIQNKLFFQFFSVAS